MKKINKKFISSASCSVAIIAFFIWYFFPVIGAQWYSYKFSDFHKYLCLSPENISELKSPPIKWENIAIDKLSMKLPLSEYNEVSGDKSSVRFKCKNGPVHSICFSFPVNPVLSYQEQLDILNSIPDDISIFHSRNKNLTAFGYQIAKIMSVPWPGLSKIISVQDQNLKALCKLIENGENNCIAHAAIYDQNGAEIFNLMFLKYKDLRSLETDLLDMIGGIKTPLFYNDINNISEDIRILVNKLNKT